MPRHAWIGLFLIAALPPGAFAQGAAAPSAPLNETQKQGERLFYQSCGVCHTKPQITSAQYAPVLSKESGSGQDDVIRGIITNGTPRMPGFKYQFEPEQIGAIVAYLKTIPAPPAPAAR
jgi:mono/diheme cytochrome c family protein